MAKKVIRHMPAFANEGRKSMGVDTRHRRVQVVMPKDLVESVDALVGKRRRSQFIAGAVTAELRRRRLRVALAEMGGSLAGVDIPGWETPEAAAEWVRALRRGDPVGVSAIPDG